MLKQLLKGCLVLFFLGLPFVAFAEGLWIDVRSAEEYQSGHIEDAINIPHTQIQTMIEAIATEKDTEIHLYCGSGRRAGIAKETLTEMGYTNLTNEGGYENIKKSLEAQ